jgi:hypothetical protein
MGRFSSRVKGNRPNAFHFSAEEIQTQSMYDLTNFLNRGFSWDNYVRNGYEQYADAKNAKPLWHNYRDMLFLTYAAVAFKYKRSKRGKRKRVLLNSPG